MNNVNACPHNSSTPSERYRDLWRDTFYLRGLIVRSGNYQPLKSVFHCRQVPIEGRGHYQVSAEGQGGFLHEHTCKSPILCPICSQRIASHKGDYLRRLVHNAVGKGYSVYMLTLTLQHSRYDDWRDTVVAVRNAKNALFGDKAFRSLLKELGYIGRITTFEAMVGTQNGIHPHYHILLVGRQSIQNCLSYKQDMLNAWHRICKRGGRTCNAHGLDIELCSTDGIADYCTKISQEMVCGAVKNGRLDKHFSYAQLLRSCRELHDMLRFHGKEMASDDYEVTRSMLATCESDLMRLADSLKGVRCMCLSRGLAAKLDMPNLSEDDLADEHGSDDHIEFNYDDADERGALDVEGRAIIRYQTKYDVMDYFRSKGVDCVPLSAWEPIAPVVDVDAEAIKRAKRICAETHIPEEDLDVPF